MLKLDSEGILISTAWESWIYDNRLSLVVTDPDMTTISGHLNKAHYLFDGKDWNQFTLLVNSFETMRVQYSPQRLEKWLLQKQAYHAGAELDYSEVCGEGLVECYSIVAIDEAHSLKDRDAANTAVPNPNDVGAWKVLFTIRMKLLACMPSHDFLFQRRGIQCE